MTIISSIPYPDFIDGVTVASGAQVNANNASLISQVNANAAGSGANTDITSLSNLASPPSGLGSTAFVADLATTSNNNDLVVATTNPTGFSLKQGNRITFKAPGTNTGAMTLNVNGTGVISMVKSLYGVIEAFAGNEFVADQVIDAYYDADSNQYMVLTLPPTPQQFFAAPTYQSFSAAGGFTYNTPSGCTRIEIEMIGGGGGGSAAQTISGAAGSGGTTTFGSITVNGGNPGSANSSAVGGEGGAPSGTNGSGGWYFTMQGGPGPNAPDAYSGQTLYASIVGPTGAASYFGAGGTGTSKNHSGTGAVNYGAGGGGAYADLLSSNGGGGAGGAGQYARAAINSPASSYSGSVGAAGVGGTGSIGGTAGAPGLVIVKEFYEVF